MTKTVLTIKDLYKSFSSDAGIIEVLKDINLDVQKGELLGIFGKSGSGKSTLMNMVTGIDRPTKGEVWIKDIAINNCSESRIADIRGKNIGIVFQFFQLLPMLTVIENVVLPMDFCNAYSKSERRHRAMNLLKKLGIEDQAYKYPNSISGGQQQRAAIARALANDPEILIADEPTGNLDSKTASNIFDIFKQQAAEGKTVLIVTHDESLKNEFSRHIVISDGKIIS